jgi:L-rhamnose-H+ transport protein
MENLWAGFALIFFAALSAAAFGVPVRVRRVYEWENTWLLGFLFAQIIIPLMAVELFLPTWQPAMSAASPGAVWLAMVFGFLWGWGAVTSGLGITSIGLSLAFAVIMGINMAVGSIIPMLRRWDAVPGDAKVVILAGIGVCIAGVAICGKAGVLRERGVEYESEIAVRTSSPGKRAGSPFLIGLSWCLISGVLSACANLGFDFADGVAREAVALGAGPLSASLGPWLPVNWGGFLAVLIGTGSTMIRKGSWRKYLAPRSGRDFTWGVAMGMFHFGGQVPYGMGAYFLGRLGTTVGWVVFTSCTLMAANGFGFVMGEWKGAPRSSFKMLFLGLSTLVIAMVVLAYGNKLVTR